MSQTKKGELTNHCAKPLAETPMPLLHPDEAKAIITSILVDFTEGDAENLIHYLEHVGFDIAAIQTGKELLPAWLGHYRIGQGTYDIDRALLDFTTWPPIAREIFRLLAEKAKTESLAK